MMPPFREAPTRWLVATAILIVLALAVLALAGWNVSLVQKQKDQEITISKQRDDIKRLRDRNAASDAAEKTSRVTQCISARTTGPDLRQALVLLEVVASNQVESSRDAIERMPDSQLNDARRRTILRAKPALPALRRTIARITKQIPRPGDCVKLAKKLKVDFKSVRQETVR